MNKKLLLLLIPLIMLGFNCKTNDEIYYDDYSDRGMPIPVLLTPENGSVTSENPPTLTWERAEYVDYYEVQVSEDDSFNAVVYNTETWKDEGPTVSCTLGPALNTGTYYWRVRSLADPGG
jgi:hypothetical protein